MGSMWGRVTPESIAANAAASNQAGVFENKHATDVKCMYSMSKQSAGTRPEASLTVYPVTWAADSDSYTGDIEQALGRR
jgi:hypothetical protein